MQHRRLEEVFGDSSVHLLAVEMGLTSIPPMCRRISALDRHALFACSDAHSLENIGRECTLLETEPGYAPLFSALRRGSRDEVIGCLKVSIFRARYFRNWCGRCQEHYDGTMCPQGHGRLVTGSREWLEEIADRAEPVSVPGTPRFRMFIPLCALIAEFFQLGPTFRKVGLVMDQLLRALGNEREILTKSPSGKSPQPRRTHWPTPSWASVPLITASPRSSRRRPSSRNCCNRRSAGRVFRY
jgi:PHP family Zn ribbon phosphoesterase